MQDCVSPSAYAEQTEREPRQRIAVHGITGARLNRFCSVPTAATAATRIISSRSKVPAPVTLNPKLAERLFGSGRHIGNRGRTARSANVARRDFRYDVNRVSQIEFRAHAARI
jgi:hypothetical protein